LREAVGGPAVSIVLWLLWLLWLLRLLRADSSRCKQSDQRQAGR